MARKPCIVVLGIALLLAVPAKSAACTGAGLTPAQLDPITARGVVICLINKKRRAHHRHALRERPALNNAASGHSTEMVTAAYFSHSSSTGASPTQRVRASGYLNGARAWSVGENLHWGTDELGTPAATVRAWMASASHRHTLLGKRWRHIGVGYETGSPQDPNDVSSGTYTADFALRKG